MQHLRYFKRLSTSVKHKFFKHATFVKYEAQHKVFSQGDEGDYMYVILKGKVAVKVQIEGKEDISVLIAMPADGECFGELSLYDFNKI